MVIRMKKFFIIVISLAVLMIAAYSIVYVLAPASSTELEQITHEVLVSCEDAYIVRDETVYYAASGGVVYNSVAEGERVSNNTVLSSVYSSNADPMELRRLKSIDKRINTIKKTELQSGRYSGDTAYAENEISGKMNSIIDLADEGEIEKIHMYREDINILRAGADISADTRLEQLESERASLEAGLSVGKTDIVSDRAGIFSSYVDGLEASLLVDSVADYNAEYIRSLSVEGERNSDGYAVGAGTAVCKIMNNHVWYILGITNSEYAQLFNSYENATVRFPNLTGSQTGGRISYVSEPDENDECIFLIEIPSYIESAFAYRNIDTDIVFEEHSGYKIPTEAIRIGENMDDYYVFASIGSETYRCDCNILYTDTAEGYSIIESKSNATNKLSMMERLIIGEK